MPDFVVEEETESGWKQLFGAQVSYQDATGRFVSREAYVAERDNAGTVGGYGGDQGYGG